MLFNYNNNNNNYYYYIVIVIIYDMFTKFIIITLKFITNFFYC